MKKILKIILIGLLLVSTIFSVCVVVGLVHEGQQRHRKERIIDTYRQSLQDTRCYPCGL